MESRTPMRSTRHVPARAAPRFAHALLYACALIPSSRQETAGLSGARYACPDSGIKARAHPGLERASMSTARTRIRGMTSAGGGGHACHALWHKAQNSISRNKIHGVFSPRRSFSCAVSTPFWALLCCPRVARSPNCLRLSTSDDREIDYFGHTHPGLAQVFLSLYVFL